MKKSFLTFLIAAVFGVAGLFAAPVENPSEAIVLKITGSPMVNIGTEPARPLKVGEKLPQGAIITTPATSEVEIQTFSGSTSTIKPGSTVNLAKLSLTTDDGKVTKQTALLDLTVGTVVSVLDPAKKSINNYGVQTPRGVAAARGTKYSVTVTSDGIATTVVTRGTVVFINPVTKQSVEVKAGFQVTVAPNGVISEPVRSTQLNAPAGTLFNNNDDDNEIETRVIISNDTL